MCVYLIYLSISFFLSIYLSVYLSIYLSNLTIYIYLSIYHLSVCLSIYLSIYLIWPFISIYLSFFKTTSNFLARLFQANLKFVYELYSSSYYYYSSETKFTTLTPPRALTLQTPNSVQIFRLISPGVLYLF